MRQFKVLATSLDDMAEKQEAIQRTKKPTWDKKEIAELARQIPDPNEEPLFGKCVNTNLPKSTANEPLLKKIIKATPTNVCIR